MNSTIELVSFKLKPEVKEQDFKQLQARVNVWAKKQDGFYYRTLVQENDGEYLDIVHWASESAAKAAGAMFMEQDFAKEMMALIDEGSIKMRHTQALSEIAHD